MGSHLQTHFGVWWLIQGWWLSIEARVPCVNRSDLLILLDGPTLEGLDGLTPPLINQWHGRKRNKHLFGKIFTPWEEPSSLLQCNAPWVDFNPRFPQRMMLKALAWWCGSFPSFFLLFIHHFWRYLELTMNTVYHQKGAQDRMECLVTHREQNECFCTSGDPQMLSHLNSGSPPS